MLGVLGIRIAYWVLGVGRSSYVRLNEKMVADAT